ncbi:hypothetical protein HY621_04425 [Candidatus Uhrbacteria bacterium]|nr:hypothetical protein [Candidatus Uhrbacteria bacterium]
MKEGSKKISNRHWSFKEKARKLRAKGMSYNEIFRQVPAAKSSISLWCRDVYLTEEQRRQLSARWDTQKRGIKAIQKYYWQKQTEAFYSGVAMVKKIKDHEFIAGLMLYWAEGNKKVHCGFSNSDERVIEFMVQWFRDYYGITPEKIGLHLHLHSGQNEQAMQEYWSSITRVPLSNFIKSFIKSEGSGYRKNILYHGTVRIQPRGASTYLLYKVLGGIAAYIELTVYKPVNVEEWIEKPQYA